MEQTVKKYYHILLTVLISAWFSTNLLAQHRGDNLGFQGLNYENEPGIRALSMGGAYTSMAGDLNSLFYNPAGLSGIKKLEISLAANAFKQEWWENQDYRPNRLFVTLPFYLEGLYIPDPANNGIIDRDLALDSSYVVAQPEMGNDPASREAADWTKKESGSAFSSISAAYPFSFLQQNFVAAVSYNRRNEILDFDRNDTYLDPHIGYNGYDGFTERVDGTDTLDLNWYRFLRSRTGLMQNFKLALAYELTENIKLGFAANRLSGNSDDRQLMDKVGHFGLIDENEFYFVYDTLITEINGTSDYSATGIELGFLYTSEHFGLGINVRLPYTLTRDWSYSSSVYDTLGERHLKSSGSDELSLPAEFTFGFNFTPLRQFTFALDYNYFPLSKAEFKLARADSTQRKWADRNAFRFGIQFRPATYLSLMAGYRLMPQNFIPDGNAFEDRGPNAESWTLGASLNLGVLGRIDLAYETRKLKYADAYYSNTNYNVIQFTNVAIGYTYSF